MKGSILLTKSAGDSALSTKMGAWRRRPMGSSERFECDRQHVVLGQCMWFASFARGNFLYDVMTRQFFPKKKYFSKRDRLTGSGNGKICIFSTGKFLLSSTWDSTLVEYFQSSLSSGHLLGLYVYIYRHRAYWFPMYTPVEIWKWLYWLYIT